MDRSPTCRMEDATVEDMDARVVLGSGSQVWYGSTWVYSPEDATYTIGFLGHKMTHIRWRINDVSRNSSQGISEPETGWRHCLAVKKTDRVA